MTTRGVWIKQAPGIYEGKPLSDEFFALLKISNIPEETIVTHRLETWKHREGEDWWGYAKDYAMGKFDHPFLTLIGEKGTGKTHLAIAIGIEWMARGKTVLYYQIESLLDALREGYTLWEKGNPEGYHKIIAFTENASLLILDDLGAEKKTDWAKAKLDQVCDYRYIHRRPLIVTSNVKFDELPERIADRLFEGKVTHIKGESYRRKK